MHDAQVSEERLRKLQLTTSSSTLNLEQKIQALLAMGLDAFGLEIAILAQIHLDNYTLYAVAAPDDELKKGTVFALGETYCRTVVAASSPVSIHHASASEWKTHPCYTKFQLESYIGTPVVVDGRVFGTLNFSSARIKAQPFSARDHDFIQLMAQWIGLELARQQTEQALRQFKTTLDQTLDCVFMFDPETLKFSYVNRGATEQVGYTDEELKAMSPVDIKPEFTEQQFRAVADSIIQSVDRAKTFETVHRHKNGKEIPVEVFLQYLAPANETPRFVAIVRDITERRKIDRMKSEFISTVSHELRTPLTSIRGSIGLIEEFIEREMHDEVRELVSIAYKNTHRLTTLIEDILDVNKIESGNIPLDFAVHQIRNLLVESIDRIKDFARQYNVSLQLAVSVPNVAVKVDGPRFVQIMSNLLSNAAKFSDAGQRVEIGVEAGEDKVRVRVVDYGSGIPSGFQSRVFTKFSQADSSDTRQSGGTGLGLSITKALVEKMGGTIRFRSTPGRGSLFEVEFPVWEGGHSSNTPVPSNR